MITAIARTTPKLNANSDSCAISASRPPADEREFREGSRERCVSYFTLAQIDGIAGRRCALSACPRCPDRFRNSESTRSANSGNWPVSFDHLVGAGEQRRRHVEAKRLGGSQVDDEIELCRLLNRDVGRLRSAQDFVDQVSGAPK